MKRILPFLSLFFLCTSLLAQTGTVRGFVYNKKNGEPVIFTNVVLKGTSFGAQTDVNGFYSITKIPEGNYQLAFLAMGYDSLIVNISVKAGQIVQKNLNVTEKEVLLKEFELSSEKENEQTRVGTGVTTITAKEMNKLPSVGAEPDLAQYLQVLPGVTFTGDQGGQLYIRGGSPIQNKVLLDGMIIYNPFHSIGLFSVFDTDVVRNADVYTGGFGAEFGGRVSSIMKITTRDGDKKHFGGKVSVSPFVAKLQLEGPLRRPKSDDATASTTYVLSARSSYLDKTSKVFYPYVDTAGLPFNFTDFYGKLTHAGNNGSKLSLSAFNFRDGVKYKSLQDLSWNTFGAGSSFVLIPNNSGFVFDGAFSFSDYRIQLDEASRPSRSSNISGFNLSLNFKYFIGKNDFQWGVETVGFSTDYTFYNDVNRKISQQENTSELGVYAKYRAVAGNFVIEPSMRLQYYASLAEASPEPRIGIKYNVTDNFRLKAAAGMYSQNLIAGVSDRDVVNLFYGFLAAPDNAPDQFQGEKVNSKLQKARHSIVGFESNLGKYLKLNAEGYYFLFNQLTNINRNKIYDDSPQNSDIPDIQKADFIIERGTSKGVDVVLKYEKKRFYVWAVYSLMKVTREDDLITYAPVWDRRHNVNLLVSYNFGKKLDWEFNARWNYGSGFPFTQTQGFYENINLQNSLNADYTTQNGLLGTAYGPLNDGRLPSYHRLDVNLKKTLPVGDRSTFEFTAGVTNVYDRQNIFYFDRVKFERVNQLPILPSVGVNFKW
jgi:hypothetical protein